MGQDASTLEAIAEDQNLHVPPEFEREMEVYFRDKHQWLPQHEGEFVLIKADNVAGFYPSRRAALDRGYGLYGATTFLVKEVRSEEQIFQGRPL